MMKKLSEEDNNMHKVKIVAMAVLVMALGTLPPALAGDKKPAIPSVVPYKYGPDAKVELGADGKLKYTPDKRGNRIPDFSLCGYMGGGVKLPDVPVVKTLTPSAGESDDTAYIQAAIDEVCALPLKESGFRGALLLKKGTYRVKGTLKIHASGVVVRGEGQHEDGTIIRGTKRNPDFPGRTLLVASPKTKRKIKEVAGSRREIADSYVPWGVKSFTLKSTKGFSVGDNVVVYRPCTLEWLDAIGMKQYWSQEMGGYKFRFERQIAAIDGNRITLNVPTVNAMEDKYGGGFVYRYKEEGGLTQVGVESMRFVAEYEEGIKSGRNPTRPRSAVGLSGCVNSWARNISAVHFSLSAVVTGGTRHIGGCKFVTVQDCAYLKPKGQGGGGSRYPFPIMEGQYCLFQRCYADRGSRHSYQVGSVSRGPNVYLDCVNLGEDAGPHHRWAMGALYDNINGGNHIVPDRRRWRKHGWSGAQMVFWNGVGNKAEGTQQPTARNYFFGMDVRHSNLPEVKRQKPIKEPRSLYLQQLEDRLGKQAVENITTEAQRKAVVDKKSELSRRKLVWDAISNGVGEEQRKKKKKISNNSELETTGYALRCSFC